MKYLYLDVYHRPVANANHDIQTACSVPVSKHRFNIAGVVASWLAQPNLFGEQPLIQPHLFRSWMHWSAAIDLPYPYARSFLPRHIESLLKNP